jgi:hypothetical protein
MDVLARADREFWRGALVAGGFSEIPRWTLDPAIGLAEHDAKISDDLVARLRRLVDELAIPASSVLLAAQAKVLAALSGEREVATVALQANDRTRLVADVAVGRSSSRVRTAGAQ